MPHPDDKKVSPEEAIAAVSARLAAQALEAHEHTTGVKPSMPPRPCPRCQKRVVACIRCGSDTIVAGWRVLKTCVPCAIRMLEMLVPNKEEKPS